MTRLVVHGAAAVTLLSNGELDTLTLGQGDPGLVLANDEDVALAGGKGVVDGVLDVDNGEAAVVALAVGDDTDTAHVATAGDHGNGAGVKLDKVGDLAGGQLNLDGVVDLDGGVGVADTGNLHVSIRRGAKFTITVRQKKDNGSISGGMSWETVLRRGVANSP